MKPPAIQPEGPAGDGRGPDGRFTPGNRAGTGNPLAKRAQELRVAMMGAVGKRDLRKIIKAMVKAAIGGDVQAAKLILERTLGPALPFDTEERLEQLETTLQQRRA